MHTTADDSSKGSDVDHDARSGHADAFAVLYANTELVVVNKPADVRMDGDDDVDDDDSSNSSGEAATTARTVASWAQAYMRTHGITTDKDAHDDDGGDDTRACVAAPRGLKFVHQLDYGTSGVLCLAFSKDMAARLAHCFEMRTSHKLYLARVHGHVPDYNNNSNSNSNNDKDSDFDVWLRQHPLACASTTAASSRGIRVVAVDEAERAAYARRLQHVHENSSNDNNVDDDNNVDGNARNGCVYTTHGLTTGASRDVYTRICAFVASQTRCIEVDLPVGDDATDTSRCFRMAVDVADVCNGSKDSSNNNNNNDTTTTNGDSGRVRRARASVTRMYVLSRQTHAHPTSGRACATTTLLLQPRTGRRHQLRVHCHALGFRIVGDVTYAGVPLYTRTAAATTATTSAQNNNDNSCTSGSRATDACASCVGAQWPRMYLHAWLLRLPCSVAPAPDARARARDKRKRRRETRGLTTTTAAAAADNDKDDCSSDGDAAASPWIEFVAPVPFAL